MRRHAALLLPAVAIMFAASTLTPKQIRRASLVIFVVGIALMALILVLGPEIKGAKRWLQLGAVSIQPSEFVKPAFIVLTAWLFNESQKRPRCPGHPARRRALRHLRRAARSCSPISARLCSSPWSGARCSTWPASIWSGSARSARPASPASVSAYFLVPHVASRIDRFLDPASGDTYQADRSLNSFLHGGWFGRGPGEGTVKNVLPNSHTDFIFAVTAEEYGLIACLILLALFAFIVLRGLSKASQEPDGFIRHAVAGLIMLFGLQALINMAVNVGLLPAKGMTLPFISYGGSSLLAMALTMGFALGLDAQAAHGGTLKRSADAQSPRGVRAGQGASGVTARPILLAAGGTGGHLFPAAALAQELQRRGYEVELATDERAEKYQSEFPARAIHRVPSATFASRSPVAMAKTFARLFGGYLKSAQSVAARSIPWRSSASAAIRPCRRSWPRARSASRPRFTSRTP